MLHLHLLQTQKFKLISDGMMTWLTTVKRSVPEFRTARRGRAQMERSIRVLQPVIKRPALKHWSQRIRKTAFIRSSRGKSGVFACTF